MLGNPSAWKNDVRGEKFGELEALISQVCIAVREALESGDHTAELETVSSRERILRIPSMPSG